MPGPFHITVLLSRNRQAAFTLVEMLAVMGIIVLLLAATLPALRGLNQSESRRGAVGNLMAALDRARMVAISDGLATYVVFASPDPKIKPDLWGRAYAIYEDGDNVSFTPAQKTPWLTLPRSLAFKIADGGGAYTSVLNRPILPTFRVTGSAAAGGPGTSADVQLPFWKFDSTGIVVDPPAPPPADVDPRLYLRVLMFPGLIDANGNEVVTQNIGGTNDQKNKQFEEIDVNPATGRARYIIDPANNLSTPSPTNSP